MLLDWTDLERCLDASQVPIGLVNPLDLSVSYSNRAFGQRMEELHLASGKSPLQDWPQVQSAMQQCQQTQALCRCDFAQWNVVLEFVPVQLRQHDGTVLDLLQCQVLQANAQQHEQERFYQDLLDYAPHNTWACSLKGEVFWTNRTSNLFTYGQEEVHDLTHSNYIHKIHPDDMQHTGTRFSTGMVEGRVAPFRYRLRDHTGNYHWFWFTAAPVRNADGSVRYWMGNSINIEPVVQEEERLKAQIDALQHTQQQLREQLREARSLLASVQKTDVVAHLAGGVAHDLNNMLFVMGMHLASLQKKLSNVGLMEHVDAVRECIRKAARLATQLSGFSGRLPQNALPVNPHDMLDQVHSIFHQAVGAEAEFSVQIEQQLPNVMVDRTYLENALINLLINARDAVDGRGQITLHVAQRELEKDGCAQNYVCFSVHDDGVGMSAALQEQVFEPFFTTKPPDKGTGLGLAMVKNFVESSGGVITVESQPQQGTTMSLYLPVTGLQAESVQASADVLPTGQAAVLLVEDNEDVRKAVSLALRELGYGLITAKNIDQALMLLQAHVKPDLIISDVRMPGKKTVLDLIREVEATHHVPMVFITGYSADIVIKEGLIEGRYPVLFKPFQIAELAQKMHEVLGQQSPFEK